MNEKNQRKVFLKAYCHGNLGDDLFLRIICERYPDIQFYVSMRENFYCGLRDIENLHMITPLGMEQKLNSLSYRITGMTMSEERVLRECDAAVLLGGSMFIQNENWKKQLKSNRRLAEKAKHFFVVGANFGPYHDEAFREAYHDLFAGMDGVCFRDQSSFALFDDLLSVRKAADVVFQLKTGTNAVKSDILTVIPVDFSNRRKLAAYHEAYTDATASVCREAVQKGMQVCLISFCRDQGDEKVIREIVKKLPDTENIRTLFYKDNYREIIECIMGSRYVLASRFHGMILGMLMGCRVTPIIYDIKTENYLNDLQYAGKRYYPETIGQLSLNDVAGSSLTDISEHIHDSESQFADLDGFLNESCL